LDTLENLDWDPDWDPDLKTAWIRNQKRFFCDRLARSLRSTLVQLQDCYDWSLIFS
jgi:hypothetical protein